MAARVGCVVDCLSDKHALFSSVRRRLLCFHQRRWDDRFDNEQVRSETDGYDWSRVPLGAALDSIVASLTYRSARTGTRPIIAAGDPFDIRYHKSVYGPGACVDHAAAEHGPYAYATPNNFLSLPP